MIGVIDYGLGNMFSLANALNYIKAEFRTVATPEDSLGLSGLILPGVGAFPEGMRKLALSGIDTLLKQYKKPILGICLGMQLLFEESEEFGLTDGLSLIPGRVIKIQNAPKIPHMGWNELTINFPTTLTGKLPDKSQVYFVHSYKAVTDQQYLAASSDYYEDITAIACRGNVYGTQFHPEKSGDAGIIMLKNFIQLCEVQQ
ncbi:MAG: imidazole glycerol phosphate synthase subunit HisH [Clostridia bacterium]|nr:imidazole glycerol phosphate synthase subunit HisH [Clostridia bacterium]